MSESTFTEADVADDREPRHSVVDRAAATVAVIAAGAWIGGLSALGACAAPFVFRLTPAPYSGDAMGAAFARFDTIALALAALLLACEVVRTWIGRRNARTLRARLRRIGSVVMAACAGYVALVVTPRILELHRAGALRGVGADGAELDRIHRIAEMLGKVEVALGLVVIALHVFTLAAAPPADDDASAPLPPGPR